MEIKLKDIELSEENRDGVVGFDKTMDSYIERIDKLKMLRDGDYSTREYCEKVFSMYDVTFDKGYMDVVNFLKAKKGRILTNIPCYCEGVWALLSYDIAYYELELQHTYTIDEINLLTEKGKMILLSAKPYISVPYESEFYKDSNTAIEDLKTIEEYDFNDFDNNSTCNNNLMIDIIRSNFNDIQLEKSIHDVESSLIEMLHSYKCHALQMKSYCGYRANDYGRMIQICDDKIKRLSKVGK